MADLDRENGEFGIEFFDELCTEPQKVKVRELVEAGWTASHIWEKPRSWLNVWMIAKHHKTENSSRPYTHGYVKADGSFHRVRQTNKVRIKNREDR